MTEENSTHSKILSGGAIFTAAAIISQGSGFLQNIIFTNIFSVENYGRLALGLTIVGIMGPILQLGLGTGAKRYVKTYIQQDKVNKAYGTVVFAISVAGVLGTSVGVIVYHFADSIAIIGFNDPGFAPLLAIFSGIIVLKSMLIVLPETFQGWGKFGWSVFSGTLGQSLTRLGAAIFAALAGLTTNNMILIIISGFLLISISSIIHIFRDLKTRVEGKIKIPTSTLLSFSLPLLFSSLSGRILSSADYVLLGALDSVSSVGLYRPAFLLGSSVAVLFQALNKAFYPTAVSLYTARKKSNLEELIRTFMFWSFAVTLPIFIWVIIFRKELLTTLFEPEYAQSSIVLLIIAVTTLTEVAMGPVGTILEVHERTKVVFYTYAVAAIVNICLNLLLIPKFGMLGAALGTGLSLIILNVVQFSIVRRLLVLQYDLQRIIKAILISMVYVIPPILLSITGWLTVFLSLPYFFAVVITIIILVNLQDADQELLGPIFSYIDRIKQVADTLQ